MTNKLKDNYEIRLRYTTCGCEDQFEFNEDKSYIKCTFCNREYFGGIEELKELPTDGITYSAPEFIRAGQSIRSFVDVRALWSMSS